jgi:arylsulfatase A-like enzyme
VKNIILIDVDAMMPSRLGYGGNIKSVSPMLNKLAKSSLNCTNTFSMGNPTEFALPGLFASSYLLDDNGYRYGIADNKITFAEVLKKQGYKTSAFMTAFRPKNDRYDRGFDDFYNLIDIQVTEKNLMNSANWYKDQYNNKISIISKDECIEDMIQYYKEYLNDILLYCNNWELYKKELIFPKSSIFSDISYKTIREEVKKDQKIFLRNECDYIFKYFNGDEFGITKISHKIILNRNKLIPSTLMDINIRLKLLFNIILIWRKSTSFRSAKSVVGFVLAIARKGRKSTLTRYPSGQYILDAFSNWISKKSNSKKPFFAYIKLMDVHEMNVYSHDVQCKDTNKSENSILSNFLKDLRKNKQYSGNILYDCAIRYNDEIINKLLTFLKEKSILDNTIIVITADHGGQFPNTPIRDNEKHRTNSFVDELYRIPLMFYNKNIKPQEYTGLVSSVDINTTLLDLVGIKSPPSFRGESLLDDNYKRDYVIYENQGRGPCHLKYKPIRVCVRSKYFKIVYETPPLTPHKGFVAEVYNLKDDPKEYNNIVNDKMILEKCDNLIDVARSRVKEILH